jgi:hypothetical protein
LGLPPLRLPFFFGAWPSSVWPLSVGWSLLDSLTSWSVFSLLGPEMSFCSLRMTDFLCFKIWMIWA